MTGRTRPALSLLPDEPDQVPRKVRFQEAHPEVEFARPGGMVQACLPWRGVQVTITRPSLRVLLDELDKLFIAAAGDG